jgi:hypothetical protein
MKIEYELTPTNDRFAFSEATIPVNIGPQGEGKTFSAAIGMLLHAMKFRKHQESKWAGNTDMYENMRGVIIRDSHENIKRHTIPSIVAALKGSVEFYDDQKRMLGPHMDISLMGIADYSGLAKLQYGAEYTFGWLEEPAPMIERGSAGLMIEAFEAAVARCARQRFAIPRIQVTMNPPEEEHWTYPVFYENSKGYPLPKDCNNGEISMEVFNIPYGENFHLSPEARAGAIAAFKDNPALAKRFIEGLPAYTSVGEPVVPTYDEAVHRTDRNTTIDPMENTIIYRFYDGWQNPTCVFVQICDGQFQVIDTVRGANTAIYQLIHERIRPLIAHRYSHVKDWRDIGDPSMADPDQSNIKHSAARTIEEELGTRFEKGTRLWEPRRDAVLKLVGDSAGPGRPKLLLSHHEGILHRALRGGWHYVKDASGKYVKNKASKDIHSHPGDAFSYGIEKIYQAFSRTIPYSKLEKTERSLGASYV